MLKDNKGKPVETLEITEELWKKIMQKTLNGIIKLLDSAEKLLQNGGDEAICAGLYMYAVEEYGKFLLLKRYSPSDGKVKIRYRNEFISHPAKFGIALEHLPKECITLKEPDFSPEDFNSEDFDTEEIIADFEARLAIFYSGFTDSGDDIKSVPSVDENCLKKAINQFKSITLGKTTL